MSDADGNCVLHRSRKMVAILGDYHVCAKCREAGTRDGLQHLPVRQRFIYAALIDASGRLNNDYQRLSKGGLWKDATAALDASWVCIGVAEDLR